MTDIEQVALEYPSGLYQPTSAESQLESHELEGYSRARLLDRFFRSRFSRVALAGLTSAGIAGGLSAIEASPAYATNHTYDTTDDVWLHSDPGLGDQGDLIKVMPRGTRFTADCYVNDTPIGPLNNPAWLHGKDETGSIGYFTDYYSSSHWDRNNTLHEQGLPFCEEQKTPPPQEAPSNPSEDIITSVSYDSAAAVSWARAHARDTPQYGASCTWFVSNALWAGGLPKDAEWTNQGESGHIQKRPGTKSAWAVNYFLDYVRGKYPQSKFTKLNGDDFRNNKVPTAERGAVMIYDWEDDGMYDHAAIVTDIVGNQYPEVAEWSIYNGRKPTPYVERGWTYSEKSNMWIQTKFPHVVAYLLDIDTTQTGSF